MMADSTTVYGTPAPFVSPYQVAFAVLLCVAVSHPSLAHTPGNGCSIDALANTDVSRPLADSLVGKTRLAESAASHVAGAKQESVNMSSGDIEKRGRELQAALRNGYHQLRSSGKLAGLQTDITSYILPYLSPGISFEAAEKILADAGFAVRPRPSPDQANNPNRAIDWYGVLASLSLFVEDPPNKVSVYVTLLPKSPGDYSTVDKLTASIFISGP